MRSLQLRLVPLSLDHLDHTMTWVNDREVMQYFANHQKDISREDEAKYLQKLIASPTDIVYSIFDGEDKYVGQCSINQIHWPAMSGRLFVVIQRDRQGEGYGPLAVKSLLNLAWEKHHLHKIWLIVRQDNRKAQAMYLKLGFDFEGLLRDEYKVGDRYFDMVRMGLLNHGP